MKGNLVASMLLLAAGTAMAEPATITHATDVLAQPQSDAAKVTSLSENTKVDLLARQGAWDQIKAGSGQGWVRMSNVRPDGGGQAAPSSSGGNALASLLSSGRTSNSATSTTGVRGLTEEDLQNAQANPAELQKMQKYKVGKEAGQAFAQRNKLQAASVEYLKDTTPANDNSATPQSQTGM